MQKTTVRSLSQIHTHTTHGHSESWICIPRPLIPLLKMWDHLYREQKKTQLASKEELWNVLQEAWRTILEDWQVTRQLPKKSGWWS